ncbi:beta strand repeat-containing protein, partial [Janthinobacterium agaricidamnosum]|uniref:beta strand repeat-containing protein n=1 Tax=Janthinobacterium agaricidamnosum TaxID=55508 RepID=UPI000B204E6F
LGGADAGNYNLASDTAGSSASIGAKALTLTGLSGNKVYDGTVNATLAGGTLNGLVNSETLAFTVQGATFGDKNAGTGKAITVGGVTLGDGTGLASNYTLATPGGVSGDITKATISAISGLTASSKVYDGNLNTTLGSNSAVINGKIAGDDVQLSGASGQFTDKNVGTGKTVNITGITLSGSDLGNYNVISNTASTTADITPKTVTLTGMTADNKVYDGTAVAVLSGGTLSGVVSGETLSFSGGVGVFSDKNAGAGKLVTVSGTTLHDGTGLASNYTFSSPANLNADISKATISSVSNIGAANKTYDGLTGATLNGAATFNGMVAGDSLAIANASGSFSDKNAGNGKTVTISGIVLGGADAGNYSLASSTASTSADITPKALTVSGTLAAAKVYDGNNVAQISGGTLDGLVAGETLGIAGQTAVFSDKNAASGKTVTVSGTTLVDSVNDLASNYTVSNPMGLSASITPKALTLTGTLVSNKVYDGNNIAHLSGGTLNGLVGSETLGIAGQTALFSDKNAANAKTVTVSGTTLVDSANGLAGNYTVGDPTGLTASITRATIASVAGIVAVNKVYDGSTAATLNTSGATFAGKVAGDELGVTGAGGAFSDKNVGNGKTVNLSGIALSGADAGNYVLASGNASTTAAITPATLTVSASGINKVYDAGTAATVNLRDNRIGNDVFSIGSGSANFSDKNAGVGKTVTVNGISISGADAGNYIVNTTASTTASIAQAALTVKVDDAQKNQGSANPPFSASYNGLLGGDTLTAEVSGNLVFNTPATTGSAAGNYVVSASGQSSNNYALGYVDGVLKVNPATSLPPVAVPPAPLQSAVANVIAMATVAPSQGNMVPSEISIGDAPTAALVAAAPADKVNPLPVVQLNGSVATNLLPGLKLSVIDRGLLLPVEASVSFGNGGGRE